ncbi:3'-5' exonuclease [Sulfurimonas sp. HSL1-6]|uniref:3'-5' exonuclease n=1 Tax=Thiomicrolovo immobilis TaxID=3131935 RepID=UPI0031F8B3E3
MAKFVLLDTETTGAGETDRIIQLGFIVLEAGQQTEVYNDFCSAEVPIAFGAMEVHHITPEMIEGKPLCTETTAYRALMALNRDENYLVIHNAPFDLGMLEKEGFANGMKLIDTLRCARHVFEEEEAHRLQYFRYKMGLYKEEAAEAQKLGVEIKAHDAIGDVLTLKLFLSRLRARVQERFPGENPVEKMVALTKEPVFYKGPMRFGKYKGKTLFEIAADDRGYLQWMMDKMENLDDDMRYSVNRVLSGV